MHFHRDLLAAADTFSRHVLKPVPDDLFAGTPPLAFTFGLGALLLFPLRVGAATLLLEKASPAELADAIAEHGVTVLSTAPDRLPGDARGWQGGPATRPAPPGVGRRDTCPSPPGRRSTTRPASRSSTASAAPRCCTSSSPRPTTTSGPARPARRCRATPRPSSARTASRCRTASLAGWRSRARPAAPYLNDERQRTYVQDGWNLTGDTYIQDEDGYFWYQARSDDMIISGGYNIAGPEIEEVLLSHPDVAECGVVGVPDEARGQIVKAYVVLIAGGDRRRGQGPRTPGPGEAADRPVQVPAGRRVRRDAAPHEHRQAPAVPAAAAGGRRIARRTGTPDRLRGRCDLAGGGDVGGPVPGKIVVRQRVDESDRRVIGIGLRNAGRLEP